MIRMQNSILNTNHVVLALGRCILRPFRCIFIFILVSVYMVVVRVCTLSNLEIVRLGIPRLGTWRKQKQGLYKKVMWPPMALRIGLLRSSALQNAGHIRPVILQCRTPRETDSKARWGPFSDFSWPRCLWSWSVSALSSC